MSNPNFDYFDQDEYGINAMVNETIERVFNRSDEEVERSRRMNDAEASDRERGSSSSKPKAKRRYIHRDREEGGKRHYEDYFSENPRYPPDRFRRRYRMRRPLFDRVFNAVVEHDSYFRQKVQVTGELGLTPHQKISAAFRLLAYGVAADYLDEYLRIGESTSLMCLRRFCQAVIDCFAPIYLRQPTDADRARILQQNELRGFPGMLGSIDCMHWHWKNCPKVWQATYTNYKKFPSIVLEGVADYDGWFWHVFFGLPGSLNDINVMDQSTVWQPIMNGDVPAPRPYQINGETFHNYYYLGDGIYPKLSTIVKSIQNPVTPKDKCFAAYQEGARKDIERAFGQLQARWSIVKQPARGWKKTELEKIMMCCVILHNMIVEDERGIEPTKYSTITTEMIRNLEKREAAENVESDDDEDFLISKYKKEEGRYAVMMARYRAIHDQHEHMRMQSALIEHVWNDAGNRPMR